MNNKKGKWTDIETNALLRMRTAGVPYKEIAKQLNRSAHACTQQYSKVKDTLAYHTDRTVKSPEVQRKHDMIKMLADPKQQPYTPSVQPYTPSVQPYTPSVQPLSTERNNKSWTRKEDRLLKSMVRHKATMLQLMTALKRTEKAIDSRIRTLSVKKTRKPRPAKVETTTDIGIENLIGFIRELQEENKQLRAKLESIRNALK
jgi:hypothetical protein